MKIKVSYGLTINKGNYESERIDISEEWEIDLKDLPLKRNVIFDDLKEWVWKKGGKL